MQQWRQQFDKLESVDLRYDGQIIVNPDLNGMARQPALTPAAAKTAMAAGVKTAAIVNYEKYVTHPVAPPAEAKKDVKAKAKGGAKAAVRHAAASHTATSHASAKPAPVQPAPVKPTHVQQASVTQAALKTTVKASPVAVAKSPAASHPAASAPPTAVPAGQKKPSAGIPKEAPQN